jgi:hypothetical protein
MNALARVIAFYLPQFHPIPENDQWWGKGFTEWTNVAKAKPLFRGHYQPHVPADLGFYDLRIPETRMAQADLAKKHGIEGFCYYHYWFGGRLILERPFNEVLDSGEPDYPFCVCWANHSWNSIWDGSPDRMLIEQIYPGMKDHEAHFYWLLRAFTDHRYITVDGKPLFLIYRPDDIPEIQKVTDFWRELAIKSGLKGLHLVGISHWQPDWDPYSRGLDAFILQRLPHRNGFIQWSFPLMKLRMPISRKKYDLSIYSYKKVLSFLIQKNITDFLEYPCVLPNWDNTPRCGLNGLVLHGSTPELFRSHLRVAFEKIDDHPPEHKLIFLKAWNEWAEGNHVEPDLRFGRGYLEVLKEEVTAPQNIKEKDFCKCGS